MKRGKKSGAEAGGGGEFGGVLREEKRELAEPLEFEERQVGCIGRYLTRRNPPPRCRQAGITPRPYPLRSAKVGDA